MFYWGKKTCYHGLWPLVSCYQCNWISWGQVVHSSKLCSKSWSRLIFVCSLGSHKSSEDLSGFLELILKYMSILLFHSDCCDQTFSNFSNSSILLTSIVLVRSGGPFYLMNSLANIQTQVIFIFVWFLALWLPDHRF